MKKEQVRPKGQAGGKGGGDSRLSPTPKENILQNQNRNENLNSTSLENPTKLKSTKREKSTKIKVAEKVLGGKKLLQESNISATKPKSK